MGTPLISNSGIGRAGLIISASKQRLLADGILALTTPIATTRRIAFLSTVAGVGTSAAARHVSETFARHRSGRVLATAAHASAAQHNTLESPTEEQLEPFPPEHRGHLKIQDGVWIAPADIDDRFFDIHTIDCGVTEAGHDLSAIAGFAHAICVVAPFDRARAEPAVALAEGLARVSPATPVVLVFSNPTRHLTTWPRHVASHLRAPAVLLDYDPALAHRKARARAGTGHVFTVLASALLTASLPDEQATTHTPAEATR